MVILRETHTFFLPFLTPQGRGRHGKTAHQRALQKQEIKMKRATCLLSAVLVLVPAVANAACVQDDLRGKWKLYLSSYSIEARSIVWTRCTFSVGPNGGISQAACGDSIGASPVFTAQGGFVVNNNNECGVGANFKLAGKTLSIDGTLSKDKQSAAGIGWSQTTGGLTFSLLKI